MKPEIKELWIEALNSGEYVQGQQWLSASNTYCCLGVLCELAVRDGVIPEPTVVYDDNMSVDHYKVYGGFNDAMSGTLPQAVQDWSGIGHRSGAYGDHGPSSTLSFQNDNGLSFKAIAKLIDEHF